MPASVVKESLIALDSKQVALQARLGRAEQPPPLLHPDMADVYRQKVLELARGLESADRRIAAAEALRGLIDAIVLTPNEGVLHLSFKAIWRRC